MPGHIKSQSDYSQATPPDSPRTSSSQHAVMSNSLLQNYNIYAQEMVPSPSSGYDLMYPESHGLPHDHFPYPNAENGYFLGEHEGIKVEYTGSSSLDDRDRRRRRTSLVKEKEALSNMHMRRRAQNRASQRAFRDRKEKHVKDLEHQLEDLGSKHQALLHSYTDLSSANDRLSKEVEKLTAENGSLRSSRDSSTFSALLTPNEFEGFNGAESLYPGRAFYYDDGLLTPNRLLEPCNDSS
ncbi:hypothetical protein MMC16_005139 [Acarospora aff. strigata]|nr:hypothetical protein [Acarospora aff. strigata]